MDLQLAGRLALVTGSTAGIGLAAAEALLAEGAHVVVNGRNAPRVRETAATLRRTVSAGIVHAAPGDMSTPEGAAEVIRAVDAIGSLDVLVNNVGFFEVRPLAALEEEHWLSMFHTNVMSSVRASKAFLPGMLERDWGRIVFIASEQSVKPNPDMLHYAMTKAAQVSIARGLAELTRGTGVTVNSALVAPTWTEGVEIFLERVAGDAGTTVEGQRTAYFETGDGTSSLIARFAEPCEIAAQIAFLCSGQASAVNGAAQRVDGGIVRAML